MAVLEKPESHIATMETTASSSSSPDLNLSLRRRQTGAVSSSLARGVTDSESDSSAEMDRVISAAMESEDLKTNGKEKECGGGDDKNKVRIVNRENRGGSDVKFTYRPSVPAHCSIKESPLSSDAIFKQVRIRIALIHKRICILTSLMYCKWYKFWCRF